MNEFRENSKKQNYEIPKETRKEQGIYFTPKIIRTKLINSINFEPKLILEPSFGSGEFIQDCLETWKNSKIYGVEFNKKLYESVLDNDRLVKFNCDFLKWSSNIKFDLIIGNPPYFLTNIKNKNCMKGRGNIFVLFIYKCLTEHLTEGGCLSFVIPTSFYNCSYYEPCRNYIRNNYSITYTDNCDSGNFYETSQDTMILTIKNEKSLSNPFFTMGSYINPKYIEIEEFLKGSTNLKDLGWTVKTGDVVWNQHKSQLDDNEGTIVIYTTNIINNKIVLHNLKGCEKKQMIKDFNRDPNTGPTFLVSRGYGNRYQFVWAFTDDLEFHGENHINVIKPVNAQSLVHIERIKNSFKSEKTIKFIEYFFGNGAISKTEMETIFPIF